MDSIYRELKEVFFNLKKEQKLPVSRINVDIINEIIELPEKRTGLNLLYKYEYIRDENYEDEILGDTMTYLIDNEDCEIRYFQSEDTDEIMEGIWLRQTQARTKFTVDEMTYYISVKYTDVAGGPDEPNNTLKTILDQLFQGN